MTTLLVEQAFFILYFMHITFLSLSNNGKFIEVSQGKSFYVVKQKMTI